MAGTTQLAKLNINVFCGGSCPDQESISQPHRRFEGGAPGDVKTLIILGVCRRWNEKSTPPSQDRTERGLFGEGRKIRNYSGVHLFETGLGSSRFEAARDSISNLSGPTEQRVDCS